MTVRKGEKGNGTDLPVKVLRAFYLHPDEIGQPSEKAAARFPLLKEDIAFRVSLQVAFEDLPAALPPEGK